MDKEHSIRYSKRSAWVYFWLGSVDNHTSDSFKPETYFHYGLYQTCLKRLRKSGFKITADPDIVKNYKCLSPSRRYGKWRDLEVKIEIFPAGFKFEFYQNINTGDRKAGDGEHCFDKYILMDYLMKKRFEYSANKIISTIQTKLSAAIEFVDKHELAEINVIKSCQSDWHKPNITRLDDIKQYDESHAYRGKDRDGKIIKSGEIKYWWDYKTKRLFKGTVYHSLNSSWSIFINRLEHASIQSQDLFDPSEDDFKRKRMPMRKSHYDKLLNKYHELRDYKRCQGILNVLKNIERKEATNA